MADRVSASVESTAGRRAGDTCPGAVCSRNRPALAGEDGGTRGETDGKAGDEAGEEAGDETDGEADADNGAPGTRDAVAPTARAAGAADAADAAVETAGPAAMTVCRAGVGIPRSIAAADGVATAPAVTAPADPAPLAVEAAVAARPVEAGRQTVGRA